jgi:excinuclease ABC subunit A
VKLVGASENNLKNLTVEIEIGTLTVVTGVSGSGKSSLVTDTLAPLLANRVNNARRRTGKFKKISVMMWILAILFILRYILL